MGETADQLREQVDQARDQASDTILQLEQRVAETAQQVKKQFDWRHQVEQRPLAAVGAAFAGGAVLGAMTGGGGHQARRANPSSSSASSSPGGLGGLIRKAALSAGLEQKVESYAQALFTSLSERIGEMAKEAFSGPAPQAPIPPAAAARTGDAAP